MCVDDKWLDELIKWADENKLSKDDFPRDKEVLRNLKELDLDCKNLLDLPDELGNLKDLIRLNLGSNILPFMSENKNQISHLPKTIGNLSHLKELYLNYNNLASIPEEIGDLKRLNTLGLFYNKLTRLPKEIGNLEELTWLYLGGNQFSSLPEELSALKSLKVLGLGENHLTNLPKEFAKLQSLKVLNLNDNSFTKLPEQVTLFDLEELYIKGNAIKELPQELSHLVNLEQFFCDDELVNQAKEIFKDNKKLSINPQNNPFTMRSKS